MRQQTITVPGRLCLMGEHSDWAADFRVQDPQISPGCALVVGLTNERLTGEVSKLNEQTLRLSSALGGKLDIPFDSSKLRPVVQDVNNVWRYAIATSYIMRTRFDKIRKSNAGIRINLIEETLPAARGFSSSAAICVLVARAFNTVFELDLSIMAEMDIAYAAERMTGSACGRMDQIVAIGQGRVASMSFDIESVNFEPLQLSPPSTEQPPIHIVVADLGASKDTALILKSLQKGYPSNPSPEAVRLRTFLGERNRMYVEKMTHALASANAQDLGCLMTQAQVEFDSATIPFCPEQLTAPRLHATLRDADIVPLVYGGKGVGSQGDGAVQFVAKDKECAEQLVNILRTKLGTNPTVVIPGTTTDFSSSHDVEPQHGMGEFELAEQHDEPNACLTTAVIPTAGYGTRLFPASWAVRTKGLMPIVDTDGYAKPILLHLVEQADAAGIQNVTIVAAPGDQANAVRELFSEVPAALKKKLKRGFAEVAERIEQVGKRVKIAIQETPFGFGHAVSCGFADDERDWRPFVLLLGDVVFASKLSFSENRFGSPVSQVSRAFERHGGNICVIGVSKMSILDARAYGVVTTKSNGEGEGGINDDDDDDSEEIVELIEKPDETKATQMATDGMCDCVLGPYALTKEVVSLLKRNVKNRVFEGGEIQLTSALVEVMKAKGMRAVRLRDCEALDTGNAREYVRTFSRIKGAGLI